MADSLSLRQFLQIGLDEQTPDHVTISRTRRLMDEPTHQEVFGWVLRLVAERGLLKGKTIGIDATTLEANAAMRSIMRRDSGESYTEYLKRLAEAEGIEAQDAAALRRMDRCRPKKMSNAKWVNPHDREAEITRMDEGRAHGTGLQGRACGGHGDWGDCGADGARGERPATRNRFSRPCRRPARRWASRSRHPRPK